MADVNRGNRPLSPHATIYRWPLNAILSITFRATGVAMSLAGVLVVWWFLAAATSPGYFDTAEAVLTSVLGDIVLTLSLAALWFHFCNGIRHLIWDTGSWFGNGRVHLTGIVAIAAAAVLTVLTLVIA